MRQKERNMMPLAIAKGKRTLRSTYDTQIIANLEFPIVKQIFSIFKLIVLEPLECITHV